MLELQPRFSEGDLIAGHYRVLGIAGAGGMGVVYRAEDIQLQRMVALKVLPPSLDVRDEQRFLREARTACSLDHQNIGVIHEVGKTADGVHFIVMAFYEGASLAERIQQGPIPSAQAVDIAIQTAEGLREAHHRGIIHRDIKPSNLMLTTNGVVKIVDFGLAQVASAATATQTGTTGTIAYMSPEQALGRQVDRRTDLWALGVTLAEMLTGRNPFLGDTIPAILFAILNDPPQRMDSIPAALQPVLYRCLAKDPEQRYGSAEELLEDLRAVRARLPAADQQTVTSRVRSLRESVQMRKVREQASKSALSTNMPQKRPRSPLRKAIIWAVVGFIVSSGYIRRHFDQKTAGSGPEQQQPHVAVLPFENIGSTPENDVLSAGLMDSLAGRLSDLKVGDQSLWVVPDSEVRRLKITDPADALQKLNANLVVKGSIERDGQQVQLHINLIDTKNLRQVGSVEVQDQTGDLATLENETVAKLAQLMHIPVTGDMLRTTDGAVNPAAYESYLTALGLIQRYDKPGNLDQAITELKKSINTDPKFAVGMAELGEVYRLKYRTTQDPRALAEAEANARKATELNDHLSEPYVTLGKIHNSAGNHDLALQEFQHAIDLNPRDAAALAGVAAANESAGRTTDAETTFRKAVDLSPDSWDRLDNLANFYGRQHRYPEAIDAYKQALKLAPDNAQVLLNLGAAYINSGSESSRNLAEDALQRSIAIHPTYAAYANLGMLYYNVHRFNDASAAFEKALAINGSDYNVWHDLRLSKEWVKDNPGARAAAEQEAPLLRSRISSHPQDAVAQSSYANLAARYGPKDQAISHLRSALAVSPDDPNVLEAAASTYENLGDRAHAITYLKRALEKKESLQEIANDPEMQPLLPAAGIKSSGP